MMEIDIDALVEQLTSAANIVTNDGYYELDTAAVAQCLDKALATTRAELAVQKAREVGYVQAMDAMGEELTAAHATIHQLGENAAKAAGEYAEEVGRLQHTVLERNAALSDAVWGLETAKNALVWAGRRMACQDYANVIENDARNASIVLERARAALTEPTDG